MPGRSTALMRYGDEAYGLTKAVERSRLDFRKELLR